MLVSELIEETRRQIFTGTREERNKLSGILSDSAATMNVMYPLGQITRGAKLSIDLEDIYVWDADGITVSPIDRGQGGSVAASHAHSAVIHVNPKFSNWEIFNAINDELNSLSSPVNGLFRVASTELVYNPVISGYDYAGTDLISVFEVRYGTFGPSREYTLSQDWEYSSDLTDEFTSGSAIFVRDAVVGQPVIIKGKFAFTPLTANLSADTSSTGIPSTAVDILSLGAAWRLTSGLEVTRNLTTSQGDTRRANEVPPGSNLGGSRELGRLREIRIREEASRLNVKYPARSPRFPYKASYG
jgi:hypothetical protein